MESLRGYIQEAEREKRALGHFNFSNLEGLHAICAAAKNVGVPVIVGVSEGERGFVGVPEAVALVGAMRKKYDHPLFLNADHTHSMEKIKEAVDAGFDAVIFDGANLSLDENIAKTAEAVNYARGKNPDILVEGELGYIGTSSKLLDEIPEGAAVSEKDLTNPKDAQRFVQETGVDLLAPAIGNLHGMFKNAPNPKLAIDRIAKIREAAGVPLVLHGGSGISDSDFQDAISAGISIVHINTEIRVAFRDALAEELRRNPDEVAPYKITDAAQEAMQKIIENRLKLFSNLP